VYCSALGASNHDFISVIYVFEGFHFFGDLFEHKFAALIGERVAVGEGD